MATSFRDPYNQLKTCPYNKAHKVKASKFQSHVATCAFQNPHLILRECPFNGTHRLTAEEYDRHLIECPDNRQVLRMNSFLLKDEKKEAKPELEDEGEDYRMRGRDVWSDQYTETPKTKAYDVLNIEEKVTAEWLFEKRFNGPKGVAFIDSVFVQKMSTEERKKYQLMCVKKIKDMNQNPNEESNLDFNENETEEPVQSQSTASQPSPAPELRPPTIQNPFAKGVNRLEPQSDDQNDSLRGMGIGRGLGRAFRFRESRDSQPIYRRGNR